MPAELIISKENKKIKHLSKLLRDREYRYSSGQYVAEGVRLLDKLNACEEIYLREDFVAPEFNLPIVRLSAKVFNAVAKTDAPQGIMALCKMNLINDFNENENYLLLDGINEPGNMGALVRSAAAFNYSGIILTAGSTDPYGPKAVRSSMGALFNLPIIFLSNLDLLKNKFVLAAELNGEEIKLPNEFKEKKHILIIGSEAHGLSPLMKKYVKKSLRIPISTKIESLNVAVAAGIMMYALNY